MLVLRRLVEYICRVSVIEASADILGSPDLHIKSGSQLRLVCTLRQSTEAPVFVFWYHGDRMINYDKERGVTVLSDRKSSVLAINAADKVDSGNYTCVPSNARPASINVHVLNGKSPLLHCFTRIHTKQFKYKIELRYRIYERVVAECK